MAESNPSTNRVCSIHECGRKATRRGLCGRCYQRMIAHGIELPPTIPQLGHEDRFWSKVDKDGPVPVAHPELGNCWLWVGSLDPQGYGHFWDGTRLTYAHRFAYGDIPSKLEVSHLCEIECCVRRSHLHATDHRSNVRYGNGIMAQKARQTHCIHGHAYTPSNTYTCSNGTRQCNTCTAIRHRRTRRHQ